MLRRLAIAAILLLSPTACAGAGAGADGGKVQVVAAFYPLQFLAERVGGDRVTVTNLVQPGVEPHDLELEPKQLATLSGSDLVVYIAGFQPQVDEAVEQEAADRALDAAAVTPLLEGRDPHVWLDPVRFATIGDSIADRLARIDPDGADGHRERARALRAELEALDAEFTARLTTCARRDIVTSHAAFGYLAARYKLNQIAISGLSPDEEPTTQRLAEVARLAREKQVTTIFFETLVSPKVAETIATTVGARTEVLDPLEGLEEGAKDDYFSVMRASLAKLVTALGCT